MVQTLGEEEVIVERIISGGQTGADQAGLAAAKILGIATGGWMPHGFRTEEGPRFDMKDIYGMMEHPSPAYPPRTEANVIASDATLIFGNLESPGCRLTIRLCGKWYRPYYVQPWSPKYQLSEVDIQRAKEWLASVKAVSEQCLGVAGNREESQPGIHAACRGFLLAVLRP